MWLPFIQPMGLQNLTVLLKAFQVKSAYQKKKKKKFLTQKYVVGGQKIRLNERVLLSTQNIC